MKFSEDLARGAGIFALFAVADAALYDYTIKIPQGKLQVAAAFNSSSAPPTISNWKDISVCKLLALHPQPTPPPPRMRTMPSYVSGTAPPSGPSLTDGARPQAHGYLYTETYNS
ncbi:hypothetical protein N7501_006173 [Penicillium viridicatum]|nr:hypothetical protein N7501_006173 [Penicillium viridicatum]